MSSEKGIIARRLGVVGFFTLVSRITGLIRDVAIAHAFGTRLAADAFFVAFRIPNLLRRLFAEGALTVAFVPVFTETLRKDPGEARQVSHASFTFAAAILVVVSLLGIALSPLLVRLTAWGFTADPEKFDLTVFLTRVMFPYILLVSLAALAMGVLNSLKHFGAPAASSIFMNLGIIAGAIWFAHWVEPPVLGLALGALVGGLLQFAIHLPFLARYGYWPRLRWNPAHPALRRIMGMMVPSAYGAAVYQFNVILITFLASFLPTGSVSYLWYADRIMEFPLGIFAVSLATVILPTLSDHAAAKDLEALKETFRFALRMIFFVTIPAAGGLVVLSGEIIRVLFQHGSFGPISTAATSWALVCFAIGLPFISAVRVTSNAFYSLQDTRTPVKIANLSVVVNVILSLILMFPLRHSGLALAVSVASLFNFVMQVVGLRRKVGRLGLKKILKGVVETTVATLLMGLFLWGLKLLPLWPEREGILPQVARLGIHVVAGMTVYLAAGFAMRMEEFKGLLAILRKRGRRPPETGSLSDA